MKILFIGDVVGRSGREALETHLPALKTKYTPDCLIVNGENSAHGKGITERIANQFYELGVDCITTGNHVWGQKETLMFIDQHDRLLRPMNFPKDTPGKGHVILNLASGRKIMIVNAMGRTYMEALDNPFHMLSGLVNDNKLKKTVDAIFVDFHAEATSEKIAIAHHLDGRVSAVIGTHTHMPTADTMILDGGTAYQSDAGMTGDYNSVIGVKKDVPIQRFLRGYMTDRMSPADGEGSVCGTFIETDDKTGLAISVQPVRVGGRLSSTE